MTALSRKPRDATLDVTKVPVAAIAADIARRIHAFGEARHDAVPSAAHRPGMGWQPLPAGIPVFDGLPLTSDPAERLARATARRSASTQRAVPTPETTLPEPPAVAAVAPPATPEPRRRSLALPSLIVLGMLMVGGVMASSHLRLGTTTGPVVARPTATVQQVSAPPSTALVPALDLAVAPVDPAKVDPVGPPPVPATMSVMTTAAGSVDPYVDTSVDSGLPAQPATSSAVAAQPALVQPVQHLPEVQAASEVGIAQVPALPQTPPQSVAVLGSADTATGPAPGPTPVPPEAGGRSNADSRVGVLPPEAAPRPASAPAQTSTAPSKPAQSAANNSPPAAAQDKTQPTGAKAAGTASNAPDVGKAPSAGKAAKAADKAAKAVDKVAKAADKAVGKAVDSVGGAVAGVGKAVDKVADKTKDVGKAVGGALGKSDKSGPSADSGKGKGAKGGDKGKDGGKGDKGKGK